MAQYNYVEPTYECMRYDGTNAAAVMAWLTNTVGTPPWAGGAVAGSFRNNSGALERDVPTVGWVPIASGDWLVFTLQDVSVPQSVGAAVLGTQVITYPHSAFQARFAAV